MGVLDSYYFPGDAFTPICNNCGVTLCWDIDKYEYKENKGFWDSWKCRDCNPDYKGSLKRYMENNKS